MTMTAPAPPQTKPMGKAERRVAISEDQPSAVGARTGYPRLREQGKNPLTLDSKEPTLPLEEYMYSQNRFRVLKRSNPERAAVLLEAAKQDVAERFKMYQQWANLDV